ncbi:hypothetical protein J4414_01425 [Candidatus Woesearchaeota archaeon]|nr:hypothetical protein [Candidatus Woesearchaeota archaeon]
MNKYFRARKDSWKDSFKHKLERSKDIHKSMVDFINEYIYFSGNVRELKSRSRRILGSIEGQLKSMSITRKELDKTKLQEIKLLLEKTRKKLRLNLQK